MKKDIHPNYQPVIFRDVSTDFAFLSRSTMTSKDTEVWSDGNEYQVIRLDISSASHPFYTGNQKIMDSEGRIEKFNKKYSRFKRK
jgi:large subunit ribosomal protein L31